MLVAFAAIGPFARVSPGANEVWQDHSYLSCMGEIAIGCLAAAIAGQRPPSKRVAAALLGSGAGLMLLVLYFRSVVGGLGLYELGLNVTVLSVGTAPAAGRRQRHVERTACDGSRRLLPAALARQK